MDIFVVDIDYPRGAAAVDPLIAGHRAFLDRIEAKGLLIASGAKVPRSGGVMILRAADAGAVAALLADDPLNVPGLADYRVTRMAPARLHPGLGGPSSGAQSRASGNARS